MNMGLPASLSTFVSDATQREFAVHRATPVGGGSINEALLVESQDGARYFVKLNRAEFHTMFAAEAAGLAAITATGTLRVPRVITLGIADGRSFLVLEYLPLGTRGDARALGTQLAALHRYTAPRFGFDHDNFIGSSAQPNRWTDDWIEFWREQRLGFQLRLAAENGYRGRLQESGKALLDALPEFFRDYVPQPSLLHGDLWGGNHAYFAGGAPVIFDPATYYGDRECDLAMTELFGGFAQEFYVAYRQAWPLDAGFSIRRDLYNLYHILNHANLFGGGYATQAEQMMRRLLDSIN